MIKIESFSDTWKRNFLGALGIEARLDVLLQNATPKQKTNLLISFDRLTNESQMGSSYKVLSIVDPKLEQPVGFEEQTELDE